MDINQFEKKLDRLPKKYSSIFWKILAYAVVVLVWILYLGPWAIIQGIYEAIRDLSKENKKFKQGVQHAQQEMREERKAFWRKRRFKFQNFIRPFKKFLLYLTIFFIFIFTFFWMRTDQGPPIERYGLVQFPEILSYYPEPMYFGPGDELKVVLSRQEDSSIFGYWQGNDLQVTAFTLDGIPHPVKLEQVSTSDQKWGGVITYGQCTGRGLICLPKISEYDVWIKFRVPEDKSLSGRVLKIQTAMTIIHPFLYKDKHAFGNSSYEFKNEIVLWVATAQQRTDFLHWQDDIEAWKGRKKLFAVLWLMGAVIFTVMAAINIYDFFAFKQYEDWFEKI